MCFVVLYIMKADVFSYGIILCEVTARVHADPEVLPRTNVSRLCLLLITV